MWIFRSDAGSKGGIIVKHFSFFPLLCIYFAVVAFACSIKKTSDDAPLEIKTLKFNGKSIEPNHEIEVQDLEKIEINDIKATFAYSKIEGEVELPLVLMNAPILLKRGVPTRVEFYVPAKRDEYQSWQGYFNAILK